MSKKRASLLLIRILSSLLLAGGIMLMLYPSFSDLFCRLYEQELRASWAEKYYLEPLEITAGSEREFQGMVLKIPAIGLDTAVQKGISPQVLKKTPGWFEESALPGQGTRQLLPI